MRCSSILKIHRRIPHYRKQLNAGGSDGIEVVIASDIADVDRWIDQHVVNGTSFVEPSKRVLGMDIEWRPNRMKAESNKAAICQFATPDSALLYQFGNFSEIPESLCDLISSGSVVKTGVGILDDLKKLEIDYGIRIDQSAYQDSGVAARQFDAFKKGKFDTDSTCANDGEYGVDENNTNEDGKSKAGSNKKYGLSGLVEDFFSLRVEKPKKIQMSNWENVVLSNEQIMYASYDALMSIDCYNHLYAQGAFEGQRKEAMLRSAVDALTLFSDSGDKHAEEGHVIEVSGRSSLRQVYLSMSESSEYLHYTGEHLRRGNANYLSHVATKASKEEEWEAGTGGDGIGGGGLLPWNRVAYVLITRLGVTPSYKYRVGLQTKGIKGNNMKNNKNDNVQQEQHGVEVDIIVQVGDCWPSEGFISVLVLRNSVLDGSLECSDVVLRRL